MATHPILDLSTERERLAVRIDGVDYAMRSRQDLALREFRLLRSLGPQLQEIEAKEAEELTDAELQAYDGLLTRVCGLALVADGSVIAKLDFAQRRAVVESFLVHLQVGLRPGAAASQPHPTADRPTGTRSSRGSSGSTAVTRRPGRRTSR